MKKSTVCILSLLGLIVILGLSVFFLTDYFKEDNTWNSDWTRTITVRDGVPDPEVITQDFCVNAPGKYSLSLSWLPSGQSQKDVTKLTADQFGFMTTIVIFSESGELIHSQTASAITGNPVIDLAKGAYHAKYYYFTNASQYESFAAAYLCGTYDAPFWAARLQNSFDSLQKNGTWTMEYHFGLHSVADMSMGVAVGCLVGLSISACLICLILATVSKGNRVSSPKYDERQEMERGRGFKYALISMSICLLTAYVFDVAGVTTRSQFQFFAISSFIVALNVYIIYCIWHEAYFALNQKTNGIIAVFAAIGLFNLLIAIGGYINGTLIHDGQFGTSMLNLLMSVTFLLLLVTVLIKRFVDARINARIEEADEEEE